MHIQNISRVVIVSDAHILLVQAHKADGTPELASGEPYYFLPGGHIEHGETVQAAAIRELKEEAGIEASRIGGLRLLGVYECSWDNAGSLYHEIDFVSLCEVDRLDAATPVQSSESHLLFRWQPVAALADVNFLPADFRTLIPEWAGNPVDPQRFFRSRFVEA